MSVSTAFDDLYTLFSEWSNWTLVDAPTRVLEDPIEALNVADFPALVLAYDWTMDHQFNYPHFNDNKLWHTYHIALYLFLGGQNTPLDELHERSRAPWPRQIAKILSANLNLGGDAWMLGDYEAETLLRYRVGKWPWGGANDWYWGYKFSFQVKEMDDEIYASGGA